MTNLDKNDKYIAKIKKGDDVFERQLWSSSYELQQLPGWLYTVKRTVKFFAKYWPIFKNSFTATLSRIFAYLKCLAIYTSLWNTKYLSENKLALYNEALLLKYELARDLAYYSANCCGRSNNSRFHRSWLPDWQISNRCNWGPISTRYLSSSATTAFCSDVFVLCRSRCVAAYYQSFWEFFGVANVNSFITETNEDNHSATVLSS